MTKGQVPEGHIGQGRSRGAVNTWRSGGTWNKDKTADPLRGWAGPVLSFPGDAGGFAGPYAPREGSPTMPW